MHDNVDIWRATPTLQYDAQGWNERPPQQLVRQGSQSSQGWPSQQFEERGWTATQDPTSPFGVSYSFHPFPSVPLPTAPYLQNPSPRSVPEPMMEQYYEAGVGSFVNQSPRSGVGSFINQSPRSLYPHSVGVNSGNTGGRGGGGMGRAPGNGERESRNTAKSPRGFPNGRNNQGGDRPRDGRGPGNGRGSGGGASPGGRGFGGQASPGGRSFGGQSSPGGRSFGGRASPGGRGGQASPGGRGFGGGRGSGNGRGPASNNGRGNGGRSPGGKKSPAPTPNSRAASGKKTPAGKPPAGKQAGKPKASSTPRAASPSESQSSQASVPKASPTPKQVADRSRSPVPDSRDVEERPTKAVKTQAGESAPKAKASKSKAKAKPVQVIGRNAVSVMFDHASKAGGPQPAFVELNPQASTSRSVSTKFVIMVQIGDQEFVSAPSQNKRDARLRAARLYLEHCAPELNLDQLIESPDGGESIEKLGYVRRRAGSGAEQAASDDNDEQPGEEDVTMGEMNDPPAKRQKVVEPQEQEERDEEGGADAEGSVLRLIARLATVDHRLATYCNYRTCEIKDPSSQNQSVAVELVATLHTAAKTAELNLQEIKGGPKKQSSARSPRNAHSVSRNRQPEPGSLEEQQYIAEQSARQEVAAEENAEAQGVRIHRDVQGRTAAEVIVNGGGLLITRGYGHSKKTARVAAASQMLRLLLPDLLELHACEEHIAALEVERAERLALVKERRAKLLAEQEEKAAERSAKKLAREKWTQNRYGPGNKKHNKNANDESVSDTTQVNDQPSNNEQVDDQPASDMPVDREEAENVGEEAQNEGQEFEEYENNGEGFENDGEGLEDNGEGFENDGEEPENEDTPVLMEDEQNAF